MRRLSVSRIRTALRCPRLFWLAEREDRPDFFSRAGSELTLGALFHDVMSEWMAQARTDEHLAASVAAADSPAALARLLHEHLYDRVLGRALAARAAPLAKQGDAVARLWTSFRSAMAFLAALLAESRGSLSADRLLPSVFVAEELPLRAPVPLASGESVEVVGRLDALVHDPASDSYSLLEYKLSDREDPDLDLVQVALYARLLELSHGVRSLPVLLYFTPELKRQHLDRTDVEHLLEQVVQTVLERSLAWLAWAPGCAPESVPSTYDPQLCRVCPNEARCREVFGPARNHREHASQGELFCGPALLRRRVAPAPPLDPMVAPPEILLGAERPSGQYAILGVHGDRRVALELDGTQVVSLFGVQRSGKSYTLGTILEGATMPATGVARLPAPLAGVVFHYSTAQEYAPEALSMLEPNSDPAQVAALAEAYHARAAGHPDMALLVPPGKLAERQREFPSMEVRPIGFSGRELSISDWKFLMGAVGSRALYMKQFNALARELREPVSLEALERAIDGSAMSRSIKALAQERLSFARPFVSEGVPLAALCRPGRLLIVDLRDELIDQEEALGLFVVMLRIVSNCGLGEHGFNKIVVFDEAHKYMRDRALVDGMVEVVREMRHRGTSVMIASQDPSSVPASVIELSTQVILHRFTSPQWLKHLQRVNTALGELSASDLVGLESGQALLWSRTATDPEFTRRAVRVQMRPRLTRHGGETRSATGGTSSG
ncbi:MAG: PD-(D/E)XK nuclease family protein [Planctomycetes bacterium]|nr:PD-(D/E)XK nuclease family protein [Planctomycetota bacterium]